MPSRAASAGIALLTSTLDLSAKGEVKLLPAGEFAARDGRPGKDLSWKLDDTQGQALAQSLSARHERTHFNFDYDHQTLRAEANGQPAPAAGWASSFEWRSGVGLYATDVKWTAAALRAIEADEYRYVSPVINYDRASGQVLNVQMAAITNFPALLGQGSIGHALAAQLSVINQEHDVTTPAALPSALLTALSLKPGATEVEALNAISTLNALASQPALSSALTSALGLAAGADEKAALSAIAALRQSTDTATIAALQGQIATLTAREAEREIDQVVQAALSANKLLPAQKDWAINLGKKDLALLKAYVDGAPQVAPGQTQTGGKAPAGAAGGGDTAEALAAKAVAYQQEQAALGVMVSTVEAVMHVNKGPAPSAATA